MDFGYTFSCLAGVGGNQETCDLPFYAHGKLATCLTLEKV